MIIALLLMCQLLLSAASQDKSLSQWVSLDTLAGMHCLCHPPIRRMVALEDSVSTAEARTVDVYLSHYPSAYKVWLLAALHHSANKLMS